MHHFVLCIFIFSFVSIMYRAPYAEALQSRCILCTMTIKGFFFFKINSNAAADSDADLTCILFSHNSLYIFWHTSGLKVSTNEWTSWIRSIRWGTQTHSAGVPQPSGQFLKLFQRHVLKCDAYITYCMHAQRFKVALITFLVSLCLNWWHN